MNQATAFVQNISDNQELAVTVMDGAELESISDLLLDNYHAYVGMVQARWKS